MEADQRSREQRHDKQHQEEAKQGSGRSLAF
jgi:hypothetical protein